MHEFSIATQVLDAAREAAADHGAETFEGITVSVGEASHVNPDQLGTCLDAAADSTVGEADLDIEIETVAPHAECDCGWSGEPETVDRALAYAPDLTCPECDQRIELAAGNECKLMSVTIPDTEPTADPPGSNASN
ncbi:hydrogenase maturation nickel metallochaperone HypA [Halorhabdus sp. CBA1104]|uniref:hydrogenase maturation nickel metallochaperone HypA/HybF n=1 Tax=unclassified Halorhabdus TaxID=2621901 RepID=UPI0012B27E8C|nr:MULTISPECIES: hydrogenase maturation nickel metallochaperone HypA [unclassified Halorhabdus]QGN06047.1 hydrogenase maturation nickel metallochaperone HypA [Halorhabdus sp. CBA1104]